MIPESKILLLHLFTVPWVVLILWLLRPGGTASSYDLNMRRAKGLLPGRWKERDYYVTWTRRACFFWLIVILTAYAAAWRFWVR